MVHKKHRMKHHSRLVLPVVTLVAIALAGLAGGFIAHAGSAYRPFTTNSYWNTPFEAGAPIDPNSGTYISDSQNAANTQNYLKLTLGSFAEPVYFAGGSDPLYTVTDGTNTVQVHIPNGAAPAAGSDGQMTVYDLTAGFNRLVDMHGVVITNGQYSSNGLAVYSLGSNGLAGTAAGADDSTNYGHRGIPASTRAVRLDEIQAGAINHRLECFWWATAPSHYWPMVGHENNKGGIVPEGIVVRIKPSIDLSSLGLSSAAKIIATALQQYGCMVGDNSGSGNRLKLQENVDWTGILNADSLKNIPWSDWEFVQGGAVPQGTPVSDPTPPPSGGSSGSTGSGDTSGDDSGDDSSSDSYDDSYDQYDDSDPGDYGDQSDGTDTENDSGLPTDGESVDESAAPASSAGAAVTKLQDVLSHGKASHSTRSKLLTIAGELLVVSSLVLFGRIGYLVYRQHQAIKRFYQPRPPSSQPPQPPRPTPPATLPPQIITPTNPPSA